MGKMRADVEWSEGEGGTKGDLGSDGHSQRDSLRDREREKWGWVGGREGDMGRVTLGRAMQWDQHGAGGGGLGEEEGAAQGPAQQAERGRERGGHTSTARGRAGDGEGRGGRRGEMGWGGTWDLQERRPDLRGREWAVKIKMDRQRE